MLHRRVKFNLRSRNSTGRITKLQNKILLTALVWNLMERDHLGDYDGNQKIIKICLQ